LRFTSLGGFSSPSWATNYHFSVAPAAGENVVVNCLVAGKLKSKLIKIVTKYLMNLDLP